MKINRIALNIVILSIFVVATILWTVTSNNRVPPNRETATPSISDKLLAPDFTYTTIAGETSSLYDHKGKTILLHFWASWCAPCLAEFPTLIDLAANKKDNFIILAISIDEDKSNIHNFIKRLKKEIPDNFYLIQDDQKKISQDLYQTLKLPETFIILPNLMILEKIIGPQENWNSRQWHNKITKIIGE